MVRVALVHVLRLHCIHQQGGPEEHGRDEERLDTADSVDQVQADAAVYDGQRTADADDHEGSLVVDSEDFIDPGSVAIAVSLNISSMIRSHTS